MDILDTKSWQTKLAPDYNMTESWLDSAKLCVGLEHERVIFEKRAGGALMPHYVKGAQQWDLPHDSMSCLAETRSCPWDDTGTVVLDFLKRQGIVDRMYANRGYTLKHGEYKLSKSFMARSLELDPEAKKDHEEHSTNLYRGGGLHIHFSLSFKRDRFTQANARLFENQAFLFDTVRCLDNQLSKFITGKSSYRRAGQFRQKPYGFEYRSLFWGGDVEELLEITSIAYRVVNGKYLHVRDQILELLRNFQ